MKTHELKLDAEFFDEVLSGEKPFEIRFNDRGFQKGDMIIFKETSNSSYYKHHRTATAVITYLLHGWGLSDGYCVFGIANVQEVK